MDHLTPAGNPAARFPPEKHVALDAVFAAAEPFLPGEVALRGLRGADGMPLMGRRADALVWALDELRPWAVLNILSDADLVPSKLFKRFHAIAAAADNLLNTLGATENEARFGLPDQIRSGLQYFAALEAKKTAGFLNHPPEMIRVTGDDEQLSFHVDRQLQQNIEGLFQIRRWARQAEDSAKAASRNEDSESIQQFSSAGLEKWPEFDVCDGIFCIWEKELGRPIRTSVQKPGGNSDQKVTGPLIRFTECCLNLLGYTLT